jgi:Zn finger protein HypA/HybF involved in hydrogenase expression
MGRRTSPIWTLPKDRFETVVKKSNSIAEIIRYFGFAQASSIYRMIKKRCEEDDIDYSHIPLGLGSNKGKKIIRKAFPLEEVMVENSTYNRGNLKKRLLKNGMLKNECAICGQEPIHNNKKLVMVLDHINGISDDHREENLRMLCPNCNSQEPTFAGRNRKIRKKKYFCKECGEEITKQSKSQLCLSCVAKKQLRKVINRPSVEQLLSEIEETNYCAVGRKYGVSDNAVRKWLK